MSGNMGLLSPFVFNQFGAYGTYAQVVDNVSPPSEPALGPPLPVAVAVSVALLLLCAASAALQPRGPPLHPLQPRGPPL